jgi:ubiquitin C-terminal hydrolase
VITKITNLHINALATITYITVDSKCYTLSSIICHYGQPMTEAHYTSIIKHQNKWARCNDTSEQFER